MLGAAYHCDSGTNGGADGAHARGSRDWFNAAGEADGGASATPRSDSCDGSSCEHATPCESSGESALSGVSGTAHT